MRSRSPLLSVSKNWRNARSLSLLALTMTGAPGGSALFRVDLGERFARDAHRIDARGHAAVNGDLQEHLADLRAREAVRERTLDVDLELVRPVERADHRQVEQAAIAAREAGAAPDAPPAVLGRELEH